MKKPPGHSPQRRRWKAALERGQRKKPRKRFLAGIY
jgi:hypothetical protein